MRVFVLRFVHVHSQGARTGGNGQLAMSIISCAVYIMSVAAKIPIIQTTNNKLKGSKPV